MTPVGTFLIEAGHPSLPGHFPGRPIVPGVILMAMPTFPARSLCPA